MLEVNGVRKFYQGDAGRVVALDDASLTVGRGEFVAVRGPSGCGKTTLLLIAGALLAPDAGTASVDGEDVYALPQEARARLRAERIGFVFQQFHLVPYLSVWENILAPSLACRLPDAEQHAGELVARFGLEHRRAHVPSELSTGERQRAALARALLTRPGLLLADEPTGNLDPENAEVIFQAFAEFVGAGGALLLVTHDAEAAARAHRIVSLRDGKVV